jgi:hypothetical protein
MGSFTAVLGLITTEVIGLYIQWDALLVVTYINGNADAYFKRF